MSHTHPLYHAQIFDCFWKCRWMYYFFNLSRKPSVFPLFYFVLMIYCKNKLEPSKLPVQEGKALLPEVCNLYVLLWAVGECGVSPNSMARLCPCGQVCEGLTRWCPASVHTSVHTKESGTRVSARRGGQMVAIHLGADRSDTRSQPTCPPCIFKHYLATDYMHHLSPLCLDKSLMLNTTQALLRIPTLPSPVSSRPRWLHRGKHLTANLD